MYEVIASFNYYGHDGGGPYSITVRKNTVTGEVVLANAGPQRKVYEGCLFNEDVESIRGASLRRLRSILAKNHEVKPIYARFRIAHIDNNLDPELRRGDWEDLPWSMWWESFLSDRLQAGEGKNLDSGSYFTISHRPAGGDVDPHVRVGCCVIRGEEYHKLRTCLMNNVEDF